MGQYWQLINIDKRQTFGHWGKFQEILCNQLHDTLIPYLAIPITPLDPSGIEGAELLGSWAGDRLICVGDYVDSGDYPEQMFTTEELQEATETNLYRLACNAYKEVPEAELPHEPLAFAHDKIWVLRNLSEQVYVRVDAFKTAPEHISGPAVKKGRSLADVLLSQIGWSGETERAILDAGSGRDIDLTSRLSIRLRVMRLGRMSAPSWPKRLSICGTNVMSTMINFTRTCWMLLRNVLLALPYPEFEGHRHIQPTMPRTQVVLRAFLAAVEVLA